MHGSNIKDYYYILGLAKNASKDEIKTAHRKLSLKFHPDQNNGDKFFEERFKDIQEAYETLSDDIRRKLYDNKLNANSYTNSSQNFRPADAAEPSSFSTSQKKHTRRNTGGIIMGLLFLIPVAIKFIVPKLYKKDSSESYNSSKDTTKYTAPGDSVILLKVYDDTAPVQPIIPDPPVKDITDIGPPGITPDDTAPSLKFKDDDGLTAEDVIKDFFNAFNNNDCHKAWDMTYNTTWIKRGQDWFCSSVAFGGEKKVVVRNIYPVSQNDLEAYIYAEYYAEDIYNGNKCFKQTIIVQKFGYTDNKLRWRITKMQNNQDPVTCDGY